MSELEFIDALKNNDILLTSEQIEKFKKYASFLLEYNSHTNLTAIKTIEEVYLKHFYDSLMLLKFVNLSNERIIDIGCGAGFPGVPLKIVKPELDLVCLDSNGKKTKFLEELKYVLGIDYEVINDRAENYVKKTRESFDIVTSRAVTNMPVLAELSLPFVKVHGSFISYKGVINENIENGLFAIETLGGKVTNVYNDTLPKEDAKRSFIVVEKVKNTDIIYPRLFDKINKKPLQK